MDLHPTCDLSSLHEISCPYTQTGIHKERPASVHVNQQVHLDLLPIDSRRPARGGFCMVDACRCIPPAAARARKHKRSREPRAPASRTPCRTVLVWMTAGAFAAEWWGSVMSSTNPAVAAIEHLAPSACSARSRAADHAQEPRCSKKSDHPVVAPRQQTRLAIRICP